MFLKFACCANYLPQHATRLILIQQCPVLLQQRSDFSLIIRPKPDHLLLCSVKLLYLRISKGIHHRRTFQCQWILHLGGCQQHIHCRQQFIFIQLIRVTQLGVSLLQQRLATADIARHFNQRHFDVFAGTWAIALRRFAGHQHLQVRLVRRGLPRHRHSIVSPAANPVAPAPVYLVGRFLYLRSYVSDPARRGAGFGLSMLPILVLLLGALAGLALGLGVSLVLVHVVNPQSFHWTMDLVLPWARLLALCVAVVIAGTATAWLAGRAAAGRDAVQAVKEDW